MRPDGDFLPYSSIVNIKSKYSIQTFGSVSSPNSICEWIYKTKTRVKLGTFILFVGQRFRALSSRGLKGRVSFARQVVCHKMD